MSPGSRPSHGTRPTSTRTTPITATSTPRTISARPSSDIGPASAAVVLLKQRSLAGAAGRRGAPQVRIGLAGDPAAARLARQEADLEQIRFHDLRERLRLVVDG